MFFARSNGCRIAYDAFGEGPPLILHPGMFQVGAHWTHAGYTDTLAATHTVVTVDPVGLGASDVPDDPAAYSLARRADYIAAVLDDVGAAEAAFWGYALGAITGLAVAVRTPQRLTRLVAGAFDPVEGFGSAIRPMLRDLGLPAGGEPRPLIAQGAFTDSTLFAALDVVDPAARVNRSTFSTEPGPHARLADVDVPMFLYAGAADPWHDPMRAFAENAGASFFSLPDADHEDGWNRSADVLARVLPFLAGGADAGR